VDAGSLEENTVEELRYPFQDSRLVSIGTFLGKWVARCSRGASDRALIEGVRTQRGFVNLLLEMKIKTGQRPLLTEGGLPVTLDSEMVNKSPQPRWRLVE